MALNDYFAPGMHFGLSDTNVTTTAHDVVIPPLVNKKIPVVREMEIEAGSPAGGNTDPIYVASNGVVAAAATGIPLLPGAKITLRNIFTLSVISAAGTQGVTLRCQG